MDWRRPVCCSSPELLGPSTSVVVDLLPLGDVAPVTVMLKPWVPRFAGAALSASLALALDGATLLLDCFLSFFFWLWL